MGTLTSRRLSGLPPRNRVAWCDALGGGFWGVDLTGKVVRVTRMGVIGWIGQLVPLSGDALDVPGTASLTRGGSRARVNRLAQEGSGAWSRSTHS